MHVLITGGCGFVGRHFTKRLYDKGWEITIVDNLMSESAIHPLSWPAHLKCPIHHYVEMDCIKYFEICEVEFDLVLHLAAVVGGRSTIENQPLIVTHDLAIDSYFFQWVAKKTPKKVVYFSSSAAYPVKLQEFDGYNMCEDDLKVDFLTGTPDLTYGWAKMTGEMLAKTVHKKHGIDIVCYRPFSGYGEDQHRSYPFTNILHKVFTHKSEIDIWSNAVRDFVYIEDVVDCVLMTMGKIHDGSAINICSGIGTSFVELVHMMKDIYSNEAKIIIRDDKPKGVQYRVGDPTFVNTLGWKNKTTVIDGINKILDYWESTSF